MCTNSEQASPIHGGGDTSTTHATYLVIGAGTAGLSFIDSLLTLDFEATVILVDRNSQAGGHWVHAYPFVRLHQTSCNYGVNSLPLSKIIDKKGNEKFSHDLASGKEILDYYKLVVEQFRACGRVQLYFNCEYSQDESGNHIITNTDNGQITRVTCKKTVKVHTNVLVPSMRDGPPFPVDSSINYAPLNELPTHITSKQYNKYVVIGAGKTGCDAITYLLQNGVDQSAIKWIISRDVWFFIRDGLWKGYETYRKDSVRLIDPLVHCNTLHEAFLQYESDNIMGRIDSSRLPKVFKGAAVNKEELEGFRSIKDIVRMGRVTNITADSTVLEKGSVPLSSPGDTLFIDCMADIDHTFYGYSNFSDDMEVFEKDEINLGPAVVVYNVSCSSAIIAYIESTFADDADMKNSLLYFLRGKQHSNPDVNSFFGSFYMQSKTFQALQAYPPAMQFVFGSRTLLDAPCHHKNGLIGFLWAAYGPLQLAKKTNKFIERVENGFFPECQDCFGHKDRQLPKPSELKIKDKPKVKSNYPPEKKSKSNSKFRLNCCATMEVVHSVEKATGGDALEEMPND